MSTASFDDSPISSPDQDKFETDLFARTIAGGIKQIAFSSEGVTIAINGVWGSGKSSAVKLVRHYLEKGDPEKGKPDPEDGEISIVEFTPWWFSGQEALTLAFMQELNAAIGASLVGESIRKVKKLFGKIGKKIFDPGSATKIVAAMATGNIVGGTVEIAEELFSEKDSLDQVFADLKGELKNLKNKKILVIIDDIDRLTPDEALCIFKLVKSVGRLPNIIYLLAFDRELAEKIVSKQYPSEGPHFLDKIIQASFELPRPPPDMLRKQVLDNIEQLCGEIRDSRAMDIFNKAIAPYMQTPRDAVRLSNTIKFTWSAVKDEVYIADFIAMETMRLHEPALYNRIRASKHLLFADILPEDLTDKEGGEKDDQLLEYFLQVVDKPNYARVKKYLKHLFPQCYRGSANYWDDKQRRVCSEQHFDTYFRLSLGDDAVPQKEIDELIGRAGEQSFIQRQFRAAIKAERRNGHSRVPLLLYAMTIHAEKIAEKHIPTLVEALFEMADEFNIEADRDDLEDNNFVRLGWLIKELTREHFSLEERSDILENACKNASIAWLGYFVSLAKGEFLPRYKVSTEQYLFAKDRIDALQTVAIDRIKQSAKDGSLIEHPLLVYILDCWEEFDNDDGVAVRAWAGTLLDSDEDVAHLARVFTNYSFVSGVGDAVSTRRLTIKLIDKMKKWLYLERFRARLEELHKKQSLAKEQQQYIDRCLQAWTQNGGD